MKTAIRIITLACFLSMIITTWLVILGSVANNGRTWTGFVILGILTVIGAVLSIDHKEPPQKM